MFGSLSQRLLHQVDIVQQSYRLTTANIVNLPGRAAARRIAVKICPLRIGSWRPIEAQQHARDNIIGVILPTSTTSSRACYCASIGRHGPTRSGKILTEIRRAAVRPGEFTILAVVSRLGCCTILI